MIFSIHRVTEILQKTPFILEMALNDISDEWILTNEGENTWSVFDILGHLIHGEKHDWIQRIDIILSKSIDKTFKPFDRFAQLNENKEKNIHQLLNEFKTLRYFNIEKLRHYNLKSSDLVKTAKHPALGEVTLHQLLATWAAHDLNHLGQIVRVMAVQLKADVGPWYEYLTILHPKKYME